MRHPYGETITVTRPTVLADAWDDSGAPLPGPDEVFTVDDVAIAPQTSDESPEAPGVFVVTAFNLYCPPGTVFEPSDVITVRGVPGWQVEGETAASTWRNPFNGSNPGVVVTVRRSS